MPIDASLFAHIQNDSSLSGTYALQGNRFTNTVAYLNQYFALNATTQSLPAAYTTLQEQMKFLSRAEDHMQTLQNRATLEQQLASLAQNIAYDAVSLDEGEKVLLPGGWQNSSGGHAMVYQFTRHADSFHFTVINAGEGLQYHAKKSDTEKELYNPTKTWRIPIPQTGEEKRELAHFIGRLLQARLPNAPKNQNRAVDSHLLYEEILPSISYVNGVEIASDDIPDFGYTGGQLSGTCTQRCLHQMLKINSESLAQYQLFMFRFKQHALFDYAEACFSNQQPFSLAVTKQIHLAIENNLKLLNSPELVLSDAEFTEHHQKLTQLQQRLQQYSFAAKQRSKKIHKPYSLTVFGQNKQAPAVQLDTQASADAPVQAMPIGNGIDLLTKLQQAIKNIQNTKSPGAQFNLVQQLLLELPLQPTPASHSGFYGELNSLDRLATFREQLQQISDILLDLHAQWLNDEQDPSMNVLLQCLMCLQADTYSAQCQLNGLPSFDTFNNNIMHSLLDNLTHSAFNATNHPKLDKKLNELQARFTRQIVSIPNHLDFFNKLLNSEPELKERLEALYQEQESINTLAVHSQIQAKGLGALYILTQRHNGLRRLPDDYLPLINKVETHLAYEESFKKLTNPFYARPFSPLFNLNTDRNNTLVLNTPWNASFIFYRNLRISLPQQKYQIKETPATRALLADISEYSSICDAITRKSANSIQLEPSRSLDDYQATRRLRTEDGEERDYFHLRSVPKLQIALTLDYFTRKIELLGTESNQRYLEANLFQPGLLLETMHNSQFLGQFERLLHKGLRYFTEKGQHTPNSLLFVRLKYLVSRYLALNQHAQGPSLLAELQSDLSKQLSGSNTPAVTYVLNHYLLLTLIERMNQGENSAASFSLAYKAYVYLQSHLNAQILEDKAHKIQVECALELFKSIIAAHPEESRRHAIQQALSGIDPRIDNKVLINGAHPNYTLKNTSSKQQYQFNALTGTLYEENLAHHEPPLSIQHHPLIRHLGLEHIKSCLINADKSYMELSEQGHNIHLHYDTQQEQLTVEKEWTINGQKSRYELQALSAHHEAQYAHSGITPLAAELPKILTDGAMDYWQGPLGLLMRNNMPAYAIQQDCIKALNEQGEETGYTLTAAHPQVFQQFESQDFIIAESNASETSIQLPRYALNFTLKDGSISDVETGEQVLDAPSPIHHSVAGLLLRHKEQTRYLVPIARFYATSDNAERSDFYPVVHDTEGTIAQAGLAEHWRLHVPDKQPLWHYANSEGYASFQLDHGEPIANTLADALYLAYIYLATDQTAKAWQILEECTTRFGGLTGNPVELKYLRWICQQVPHVLPKDKTVYDNKPQKNTPPYVACQLKSMALLADYLHKNGRFALAANSSPQTANQHYAQLEQQEEQQFITDLSTSIYSTFSRLQRMRRHLEHTYTLSLQERKQLLHYYHQSAAESPLGALGFEWLSLSLDTLLAERDALLAARSAEDLSPADKARLALIEQRLQQLAPVRAKSSILEFLPINLTLPDRHNLNRSRLQESTLKQVEKWQQSLPGAKLSQKEKEEAINALSSELSEDEFVLRFPAYLQIIINSPSLNAFSASSHWSPAEYKDSLCKKLVDFCTKTLLANRHIAAAKQHGNIPLLCNLLYRLMHQPPKEIKRLFAIDESVEFLLQEFRGGERELTPLCLYQAKDVYGDILISPEELIAQQELRPKRSPMVLAAERPYSLMQQIGIEPLLDNQTLQALLQDFSAIQKDSEQQLMALSENLNQGIKKTLAAEERAGKILFQAAQNKKALALQLVANSTLMQTLINAAGVAQQEQQIAQEKAWQDALTLANQGPEDALKARIWAIERQAKSRAILKQADLIALYSRADLSFYVEKTGLSLAYAEQLHQLIHHALLHGIKQDVALKIQHSVEKALANQDANPAVQALELLASQNIPGTHEPAMVLLQHEEHIILRPRQVSALSSLLEQSEKGQGFKESIEKITMGGGKSKVILPILAQRKTQGNNLVVIAVPPALLATNHVDLNSSSQRLFGKRAHRFEFNRDSDCSPQRLEKIYNQFTEIMTSREYLVTTVESLKSLELKYVELLLAKPPHDKAWQEQVYWCDKINKLPIDGIIDEVHQGLSTKKKLNYTFGEPKALDATIIKNATALYSLISQDIITKAPSYDKNYDWQPFQRELASKLVNQPSSPLATFVTQAILRYGIGAKQQLIDYLTNQAMPEAFVHASTEEQTALAFFKQQVTVRLPQTLVQQIDLHYGASKYPGLNPIERTLAIPYAASNVPNERNRIVDPLEGMNKTIQMMLLKGISKELFIERIKEWQALAHQELLQTPQLRHSDETSIAKGVALLSKGLEVKLSQIDTNNAAQIEALHQQLRFNRSLIFEVLRDMSLQQIKQEKVILSSDNFNPVDQFRSVQGISGTPSRNDASYHQRLKYDHAASLGSDGYLLEVLRHKKPAISALDYLNVQQFTAGLLQQSKHPEQTRALIDIRGAFTGVSNFAIARELALQLKASKAYSKPLKHVLYFNEDHVLCALTLNKPNTPIVLATSSLNVINRLLDSTPEERFTYYDQFHTTGTDIKQAEKAHAIVLVDDKTTMEDYLQGTSRFRELDLGQTFELSVPQRMHNWEQERLHAQFSQNDEGLVFREAPAAAQGQMKNLIRHRFLKFIKELPAEKAEEKALLMQHFRPFFEDTPTLDWIALYGALREKQQTTAILHTYQQQLNELWQSCLKQADLTPAQEDIQAMQQALEQVITQALPCCLAEYETNADSFSIEVEVQKEVHHEIEVQVLAQSEFYDDNLSAAQHRDWPYANYECFFTKPNHSSQDYTLSLNALCAGEGKAELSVFTKQVHASINYTQVYSGQTDYIGIYLKPVFLVWYHLDADGLHATIVTPQEAERLSMKIDGLPASWIATTQDTPVYGSRPAKTLSHPDYLSLREQVRFFNGEFNSLLTQEVPLQWLKENSLEKLAFFTERLLPYKPECTGTLQQLKNALAQTSSEGFAYISAHRFENLVDFNWQYAFPNTTLTQAIEYKMLAQAFVYVNQHWYEQELNLDDLQQQFNLPINSWSYLNDFLEDILPLKNSLKRLQCFIPGQPFLHQLPAKEQLCLERCLGVSIERLHQNYHAEDGPKDARQTWTIISLDALSLLRLYPALQAYQPLFTPYYESCALQAESKAVLYALLKVQPYSNTLLKNIIENSLTDAELISHVLGRKGIAAELLELLASRCSSTEQIHLLLQQRHCHDAAVAVLLSKPGLQKTHLLTMLTRIEKPELLLNIASHPATDSDVYSQVLQSKMLTVDGLLRLLNQRHFSEAELAQALKHPTAINADVLTAMLQQPHCSVGTLHSILSHAAITDEQLKLIIKHPLFNTEIAELIIEHPLITPATSTLLLTEELAQQISRSEHINRLLAHQAMNAQLGDILLFKPQYDKHVDHWPWLSTTQIVSLLNGTPADYASLKQLLTQAPWTNEEQSAWLAQLKAQQKVQKAQLAPKNFEQKLRSALEDLRLKAYAHALKSLTDSHYEAAATTAFTLYQQLMEKTTLYFKEPSAHPHFKTDCEQLINAARPVLAEHRGYKQIFLDIINVVFALVGLIKNRDWRLFKANTDSMKVVDNVRTNLEGPAKT